MRMYHIGLSEEDVGQYAILTGDPSRVKEIASYLSDSRHLATNREYTSYAGFLDGVKVNVMSVGIGGPSLAIGMEELIKLGCKNFIRIGTSGGISLDVKAGDFVVANGAVRQEGTGLEYLPVLYPAVADFSVTSAICQAVEQHIVEDRGYHVGVVQSKDSFYGEMEPETMPVSEHLRSLWNIYKRTGVLVSEMECSTLFLVAAAKGVKAGALLLCIWNEERNKSFGDTSQFHDTKIMYPVAITALKIIMAKNAIK